MCGALSGLVGRAGRRSGLDRLCGVELDPHPTRLRLGSFEELLMRFPFDARDLEDAFGAEAEEVVERGVLIANGVIILAVRTPVDHHAIDVDPGLCRRGIAAHVLFSLKNRNYILIV